jgi:peptidoglycan-associated lipoprotein
LLVIVGCAKRRTGAAGEAGPGSQGTIEEETIAKRPTIREAPVTPTQGERESPLKDVFFEFDKAVLRPEDKQILAENIRWLKAHPRVRVRVEGHCDDRGTNEYNLALGDLRATTVRDYLVAGGINPKRISTISYGEERPFCRGQNEEAWACNRRDHFVVVPK